MSRFTCNMSRFAPTSRSAFKKKCRTSLLERRESFPVLRASFARNNIVFFVCMCWVVFGNRHRFINFVICCLCFVHVVTKINIIVYIVVLLVCCALLLFAFRCILRFVCPFRLSCVCLRFLMSVLYDFSSWYLHVCHGPQLCSVVYCVCYFDRGFNWFVILWTISSFFLPFSIYLA